MLKHMWIATLLVGCVVGEDTLQDMPVDETIAEAGGPTDTLEEYAAKCDAAVGYHVPEFDCDNGVPLGGQDMNFEGKCATPNVLNHMCDPGSKFQVLKRTEDVVIVAHCRKKDPTNGPGEFGDIAVIQYNKQNGATCFYQALGKLPGKVRPPSEGLAEWKAGYPGGAWQTPGVTHSQKCTGCHDNGALIRSPYLAQLKTGEHALPTGISTGFNNLNTKLRWVGADFVNDRSWSIQSTNDTTCTTCHRLAVSSWAPSIGTGTGYAMEATAAVQPHKYDHGLPTKLDPFRSPIWMRPGQNVYDPAAEISAGTIANCGMGFFPAGPAPAGCIVTPLGGPYTPTISSFASDDIAVLGSNVEGAGLSVAFSNGDGSFEVTNTIATFFAGLAKQAGVKRVAGDFNGDGRTDFALLGGSGWTTIPVALSQGDGTFVVSNNNAGPSFNFWVNQPGAKPYVGDFNRDGRADIALTGGAGWLSIPIAFSQGAGLWSITNEPAQSFAQSSSQSGVKVLVGDFNADGFSDLAAVGGIGWASLPVALANGFGTWVTKTEPAPSFNQWAATANVTPLVGDYNKDAHSDIALVGGAGWQSIPVALAAGFGTWQVTNSGVPIVPAAASAAGAKPLVGDFNKDGFSDIAIVGGAGATTFPIAMAIGWGNFTVTNGADNGFGGFASTPGVRPVAGDFNGDGYTDIALTGPVGWLSIPMARNVGFGNFAITNTNVNFFPTITTDASALLVVGKLN